MDPTRATEMVTDYLAAKPAARPEVEVRLLDALIVSSHWRTVADLRLLAEAA